MSVDLPLPVSECRRLWWPSRHVVILAAGVLVTMGMNGHALAAEQCDDPKVEITTKTIALGLGHSWGDGVLICGGGEQHYFSVQGFEFGSVGWTKVSATGTVEDLQKLEDFAGTYTAVGGAIAFGAGIGGMAMQNQHGVGINLISTHQGIQATIGPSGIDIELKTQRASPYN